MRRESAELRPGTRVRVRLNGVLRDGEFVGYTERREGQHAAIRFDGRSHVAVVPLLAVQRLKPPHARWWPTSQVGRWTIIGSIAAVVAAIGTVAALFVGDRSPANVAIGTLSPPTARGGFEPTDRPTFSCQRPEACFGPSFIAFNSFTNAPNYGDERAFFDGKNAAITESGGYRDHLVVEGDQRILLRVYIHNNANPDTIGEEASTARNTTLEVHLEPGTTTDTLATARIFAANARPQVVSDTAHLSSSRAFRITFNRSEPVNVTHRPNGVDAFVTRPLLNAVFLDDYTLRATFGDWRGSFAFGALVTFVARTTSDA